MGIHFSRSNLKQQKNKLIFIAPSQVPNPWFTLQIQQNM